MSEINIRIKNISLFFSQKLLFRFLWMRTSLALGHVWFVFRFHSRQFQRLYMWHASTGRKTVLHTSALLHSPVDCILRKQLQSRTQALLASEALRYSSIPSHYHLEASSEVFGQGFPQVPLPRPHWWRLGNLKGIFLSLTHY